MTLFTDPVAQVVIVDSETKEEWKMTYPDFPYLTGGTINYEMAKMSAFTFSLDIPYDKGVEMLKPPSMFKHGNLVKMRFGYPTQGSQGWTQWAAGYIKSDGMSLTVDANGVAGEITVQGIAESYGYDVDEAKLKAAGWDHNKIIELCAEGMGVKVIISGDVEEALETFTSFGTGLVKASFGDSFPSQYLNMSYVAVIKSLCDDIGCKFLIAPSGLDDFGRTMFIGMEEEFTQLELYGGVFGSVNGKKNTYMIRGTVDEDNNTYPCFSWSPEGGNMGMWLAAAPDPAGHGAQMVTVDEESGEVIVEILKPAEQTNPVVGSVADSDPVDVETEGVKNDESRAEDSAVSQMSVPVGKGGAALSKKALKSRQQKGNAAQKGVITSFGLPMERAGQICNLRGAGQIYDGPYRIERLTHTYAPGMWDMSLTVRREGRVTKAGDQAESAGGQMEDK